MTTFYNQTISSRVYLVLEDTSTGFNQTGVADPDGSPLILDATTEVEVKYSNEVTSYYVNSGSDNTDHIKNNPRVITFSGVISNDGTLTDFIRSISGTQESNPATAYHTAINTAIEDKSLFSVHVPNVGVITNCAISEASFSTNKNRYNAFDVRFTLKEIRLPADATTSPADSYSDRLTTEKTSSSASGEELEAATETTENVLDSVQNISN